jgi:hypothetical protein
MQGILGKSQEFEFCFYYMTSGALDTLCVCLSRFLDLKAYKHVLQHKLSKMFLHFVNEHLLYFTNQHSAAL